MTSMVSPSDASVVVKELSFAALGMLELTLTLRMDGMLMLPTKHGQISDLAEPATPLLTLNNK
jgi:hypothetical protein